MSTELDLYSTAPSLSGSTLSQPRDASQPVSSQTAADPIYTNPPSYRSTLASEALDSTRPASANPYEYLTPSFAATSSTRINENPAPDHSFRPSIPPSLPSHSSDTFPNSSRSPVLSKWPPPSRFILPPIVLAGNLYTAAQAYNTSTTAFVIGLILAFGTFYNNIRPTKITNHTSWNPEGFSAMNEASQPVFGARFEDESTVNSGPPRPPASPSTKTKNNTSAAARNGRIISGAFFAGSNSFDVRGGEFHSVVLPDNFNFNHRRREDQ
ncbi:hypothetical protein GYMLUDRAFT_46702 [Collybiopsis luxurians FD-317 M1]|uniref:Uncharacterized protein n=1 Tax=Collybiopsis luxurians FD-317 M1 TaxID=944289 RepID=A0A0D0CP74_9AGAR|nr:hypothetical protein GYMLUDRAFT_46702 [Collybiopsis luxurians FD-317 M1]